ncbi:MAG: hypothetical protein COA78_21570 [Blastopirellula sp.]|nr:MAG: hypothetical protein COA78_21570 [Blastopirellula sp.]
MLESTTFDARKCSRLNSNGKCEIDIAEFDKNYLKGHLPFVITSYNESTLQMQLPHGVLAQ